MLEKEKVVVRPGVVINNHELIIEYFPNHFNAIYDLCNLEGRILITGKMEMNSNHTIDLKNLSAGSYNLFVLDGDEVFKNTFILA